MRDCHDPSPFRRSDAAGICPECREPATNACARCALPSCELHLPDGMVCAGCLNQWMQIGDRTPAWLAISVMSLAGFLLLFSLVLGGLAVVGGGAFMAWYKHTTHDSRWRAFLTEKRQRPAGQRRLAEGRAARLSADG